MSGMKLCLLRDHDEKRRLLADPEWRARARESWDTQAWDHSPLKNPQELFLLDSENGTGPIGITLKDYADSIGKHRSDAMADWIIGQRHFLNRAYGTLPER
jgi:N-acyl-D-amino-acid deacylase